MRALLIAVVLAACSRDPTPKIEADSRLVDCEASRDDWKFKFIELDVKTHQAIDAAHAACEAARRCLTGYETCLKELGEATSALKGCDGTLEKCVDERGLSNDPGNACARFCTSLGYKGQAGWAQHEAGVTLLARPVTRCECEEKR